MREIKLLIIFICIVCSTTNLQGQELQLSQYFNAKMMLNPAQTGAISLDYQLSLNQRSQWKTISNPYRYSGFSLETKLKSRSGSKIGLGFNFNKNHAGKSALTNQLYAANFAYHFKGNTKNNFTFGLQFGYRQRSVNLDGLAWDAQYNGVAYDPTLATGENFGAFSQKGIDASFGVLWQHHNIQNKRKYDFGYSVFHYFQQQSFLSTSKDQLLPKQAFDFTFHTKKKHYDIELISRLAMQGGSYELLVGGLAKYRYGRDSRYTNNMTSSLLIFGALYRYRDAIIPTIGYNYKRKFAVHLSYDINVSKLRELSNLRGAWEISIKYTGKFKENRINMKGLE